MDVGQIPGSVADAIELLRDATDPEQIIAREVLEEARDGKIAPSAAAGLIYTRQAAARVARTATS